jgi:hypothetical protein
LERLALLVREAEEEFGFESTLEDVDPYTILHEAITGDVRRSPSVVGRFWSGALGEDWERTSESVDFAIGFVEGVMAFHAATTEDR